MNDRYPPKFLFAILLSISFSQTLTAAYGQSGVLFRCPPAAGVGAVSQVGDWAPYEGITSTLMSYDIHSDLKDHAISMRCSYSTGGSNYVSVIKRFPAGSQCKANAANKGQFDCVPNAVNPAAKPAAVLHK